MKIGLFFGSFNPIHSGHLMLAEGVINETDLDQVWFVVTPHNPIKKKGNLLADHHRLNMVRDAIHDNLKFRASDIEFNLPQPNYTAVTLTYLVEKYPNHTFSLIVGEDNLRGMNSWYNAEFILNNFRILIYPRSIQKHETEKTSTPTAEKNLEFLSNVPALELSSSQIRALIKAEKSIKYMVPVAVERMITEMGFYR
ncbi:MAG: nicotinate (nicotinamide) nucleotide adenylyltransferase [Flavobacteriales bacterium]